MQTLFDAAAIPPAPPERDPKNTSWSAFCSIAPFIGKMDERVLKYIYERGDQGATNHELEDALRMRLCTVCGCIGRLRNAGLVHDSERRRPGHTRRKIKVWVSSQPAAIAPAAPTSIDRYTLAEYAAKEGPRP